MQLTKYKIGDLIVQRREKNKNFDVPIRGVSKEGFIKPKQQEADTSIYNVFYRNDFVFNPARMELNSIALNLEFDKALCSSLYEVFYVKDESIVLPEYLNLHIKREEFARFCDYIGLGSAREYCRFANISGYEIYLPSIDKQQEIVEADRLIKRRIHLNERMIQNLEATAQTLYRKMFVDGIDKENLPDGWRMGTLEDLGEIVGGATPATDIPEFWSDDEIHWLSPADLSNQGLKFIAKGAKDITSIGYKSCSTKMLPKHSVLFSSRAPIGLMAITTQEVCTNQGFKSIVPKEEIGCAYVYYYLLSLRDRIAEENAGSTFDEVSGKIMKEYEAPIPPKVLIEEFSNYIVPIFSLQEIKEQENTKIKELQSLLLAKMGNLKQ